MTDAIRSNIYTRDVKLAEAAFDSVRKDGSFLEAADKSLKALLATRASTTEGKFQLRGNELSTPDLTPPAAKAQQGGEGTGTLTLLLGQLMALLGNTSLAQLESRLSLWSALKASQTAMGEQLSASYQQVIAEAEEANDTYQAALDTYKGSQAAYDAAQKKLAAAQAKLEALSPDDPGYAEALAACEQASQEATTAKTKMDQCQLAAQQAGETAAQKNKAADDIQTQMNALGIVINDGKQARESHLSNVGQLTMLMAMFINMVGKNSEESLKADLALFQAMQESRQKEMEKKSAEYLEEVRKAEALNRAMGCLGKILGAVLTVVSVVGAVFSGGASLALAAVGVALMIADEVGKAITGTSFMQEALKPLMEKVLQPLMAMIGKAIANALEAAGVDKKLADTIGMVAGAIIAAIAMVVAVVVIASVGKSAASKLGDMMSKMIGDTVQKLVPRLLNELASKGSRVLTQGLQRLGSSLGLPTDTLARQAFTNTLNRAVVGGELIHATTQSGGNIAQGVFMNNASQALANFTLAQSEIEMIEKWMKQAVEAVGQTQKMTEELTVMMSSALQQSSEASRFVLRQSHA
jgi:invasin B